MKNFIRVLASVSLAMLLSAAPGAQGDAQKPTNPPAPAPTGVKPAGPVGTSGPAAAPRADTSADYKLVPGDKLRIEVYKDTQLSQNLQVRPDGKITLPLVGDLPAAGKTSNELRDAITTALRPYNQAPNLADLVTVIVVETIPPTIYVMGEVNTPGPQALHGQVTVLQALATAGGFKDFAKKNNISIQRKGPAGVTILQFNYKEAVKGQGKPIYLQPGDTIIVP